MNDNEQSNPMLARIRAILAKAEDPASSPQEAEAYFAKAADLMAKYGIERAMLADSDPSADKPGDRVIVIEGSYIPDRVALLVCIYGPLNCRGLRRRSYDYNKNKYVTEIHLFGYESDLDRVELLFTSLLLQAFNGMKYGRPRPGESTVAYRKSWLMGFSNAVHDRLKAAEARARNEAPVAASGRSAALVVADRKTVVEARFKDAYPRTRKGGTRTSRGTGYGAGKSAGNAADLGGTRVGPGGRRALIA